MKETTTKNFKEDVLEGDGIKAVKFQADWCGPCKSFTPIVERFAATVDDIDFYAVDIEESNELVKEHMVRSIPTMIFFMNGMEIYRFNGSRSEFDLEEEVLPKVRAASA